MKTRITDNRTTYRVHRTKVVSASEIKMNFLGKVKDKYFNGRFTLIRLYKFIIPMQISYFHYAINSC